MASTRALPSTLLTLALLLVTGALADSSVATALPGLGAGIGGSLPCFTVPGCEKFYENLLGAIYAVGSFPLLHYLSIMRKGKERAYRK